MAIKPFRPTFLQLRIIQTLFTNKKGLTVRNIASLLKIDYKNTHTAMNKLFHGGVVKKERLGNYTPCKLNYSNEELVEYLKEGNFYLNVKSFSRRSPTEYRILIEAISKIMNDKNRFDSVPDFQGCLIFGSYARDEEKSGSDVDILILTRTGDPTFERHIKKLNLPYQKNFHIVNQQLHNFIKDIENREKLSIATESINGPVIVLYGDDLFFRLAMEFNKLW